MKTPVHPPKDSFRPVPIKRFYMDATHGGGNNAHTILLDGRSVRTPNKSLLALPTAAAATAVAAEWSAQGPVIEPHSMPLTRLSNSAIDGVAGREAEVIADMAKYAGSDLVLYRAGSPPGLVAAQGKHWDPIVAWTEHRIGARFVMAEGVMPIAQPSSTLAKFDQQLGTLTAFEAACLHVITTITGSALIALGINRHFLDVDAAWDAANVDEDFQAELWGIDEEAQHRRDNRRRDLQAAARLLTLVRTTA